MPFYNYTALKNKATVRGRIEASNIQDARVAVRKKGLVPVKIFEDSNFTEKNKKKLLIKNKIKSLSLKDKISFTNILQILTAAGIPIVETIAFMEESADKKSIKNVCSILKNEIVGGSTLADTLEKNRKAFGRIFVGLARAGEDSGELDTTLSRLLTLLKKQQNIKGRVIGALIYPIFVIVLACLVVLIMLGFVFPAFESMFESIGGELPAITRMCIDAGNYIQQRWYFVVIYIAIIIITTIFAFKWEPMKKLGDKLTLKVPLLSDLMRYANYSNFLAVLQTAYDAGLPVVNSLYLANLTLDNYVLRTAISEAAIKVQQGVSITNAMKATKQMPSMIIFMIATGEQSGRLGEMLYNCTVFIDKKLDDIIDVFTKMIEPVMLVFIGAIVLFLALALYMPLFGLYTQM